MIVGIGTAELALLALGGGYRTLAVATFVAMFVAWVLHPARIVTAQAAAGAILTIAIADGQVGPQRLVDALWWSADGRTSMSATVTIAGDG